MKRKLSVGIRGAHESAQEFVTAWRSAARGKRAEKPTERLYFESLETMLKVLTPRRLEVLKRLREVGPMSVRAIANAMKRDYKNVHNDIRILERVGLVLRASDGRLIAPWDKIVAEIALAA
ncbi:MAG: hypothetical protein ACLQDV_09175 [Candidatus Binataceae bacterium]